MVQGLPINFAIPGEGSVASYNFADIVDGTGGATYYGTRSRDSGGDTLKLTTYVETPATDNTSSSTANAVVTSTNGDTVYTFDLSPFNTPRVAKGVAEFYCGTWKSIAANHSVSFQLFKVDLASAETAFTSKVTSDTQTGANLSRRYFLQAAETQTNFKIGEHIRLKVTVTNGAANAISLGIDPTGATIANGAVSAKMSLLVRYRIDL